MLRRIARIGSSLALTATLLTAPAFAEPSECKRDLAAMIGCPLFAAVYAAPEDAFAPVSTERETVWRACGAAEPAPRIFDFVDLTMSLLHRFERLDDAECAAGAGSLTIAGRTAFTDAPDPAPARVVTIGSCRIALTSGPGASGQVRATYPQPAESEAALCRLRAISIFFGMPHLVPEDAIPSQNLLDRLVARLGEALAFYGAHVPRPVPDGFDFDQLLDVLPEPDACTIASLHDRICPAPRARR